MTNCTLYKHDKTEKDDIYQICYLVKEIMDMEYENMVMCYDNLTSNYNSSISGGRIR